MKDTLFERLLKHYKLDEKGYQELIAPVSIESFAAGHEFKDMDKAVALTKEAIANKDKIFIYGDYDADGIMSTSIVVKSLLILGVVPNFYIPNRYNDGYGITLTKAEEIVSKGVKLVITVDNGISANEPIAYLKEKGVKVLVIDHHTVPEVVPNADVIIHPSYSEFGETATSAGFVSFMFSWALLGYFDKYLSTLASISLISDMMPLLDYNRRFLRLVFANYKEGEFYPIDLLKEEGPYDENAIGMRIAPKINALGRLLDNESINHIIRYFVTPDMSIVNKLYAWIVKTNDERKTESKLAEENMPEINTDDSAIVIISDVKEGIMGLIANSICSKVHKPTIVFTQEKDAEVLKGSCRAPEGFNVVKAFNSCSDLVLTAGGHALAGGCSIYKKDFEEFKQRFIKFANENPLEVEEEDEVEIGLTEINDDNYALIQSFSPFGESWKAPTLLLRRIRVDSLTFSKSGEHILSYIGNNNKITGFGIGKNRFEDLDFVDFIGKLKVSYFKGMKSLDFNVKEFKSSK